MNRSAFISSLAALGVSTALPTEAITMTDNQREFIDQMCKKYDINPQAWRTEPDALNVALMMLDLLWGHARVLEQKVARLEGSNRGVSASPVVR